MHELGIAEEVLHAIEKTLAGKPGTHAVRAGLRIGELAGVNASALRFALEAITAGTKFEVLHIEIEPCPLKHRCVRCSHEFVVRDYELRCPQCGNEESVCIGGDELDLAFLEIEEYATS